MIGFQIFYSSPAWTKLARFGVQPVLLQAQNRGFIDKYYILLGKERGEHIKILVEFCENRDPDEIRKFITEGFQGFLSSCPSEDKVVKFPVNSFFMNFENNSITSCPKRLLENFFFNNSKNIRFQISKIILNTLLAEDYELETTLSFIIYAQLLIFKAGFGNLKDARKNYNRTLNFVRQNNLMKNSNSLNKDIDTGELFQDNNEVIMEIINDVWSSDNIERAIWMVEWEKCCMEYIKSTGSFTISFSIIINLVYEHLGYKSNNLILETLQSLKIPISFASKSNLQTPDKPPIGTLLN